MATTEIQANENVVGDELVRTVSSCERELKSIEDQLIALSADIGTKLDEKAASMPRNQQTGRQSSIFKSSELTLFIECTDVKFEECANRMSVTDLDLTQRTMEAEIIVLQGYLQQNIGLHQTEIDDISKKIAVLQDRMYRCITKRGIMIAENSAHRSHENLNDPEQPSTAQSAVEALSGTLATSQIKKSSPVAILANSDPSNSKERDLDFVPVEIEQMSSDELEDLLRHNSIDVDKSLSRDLLLEIVAERLSSEFWEPPDQNTLKWKDASSLKRQQKIDNLQHIRIPAPKQDRQQNTASPVDSIQSLTTPIESYFSLNPSDMDNYLHYKATNDEKMVDWDPTNLLKEIYGTITFGARTLTRTSSKGKKVTCMQGYLDKLPKNQTRVKTFKGWKRRFFQISRGKLYYYEDHKSETPFGYVDILGAEIETGDNNTINIVARSKPSSDRNSDRTKLVLRCGTEAELNDWLATLKRTSQIEPVPGTLTREGSLKKKKTENHPIIIDLGGSAIRAGLSSDMTPVVAFPSAFAVKVENTKNGRRFTDAGLPDPHSCRCGFEAFYPQVRKDAKIVYPLRPSLRVDKYSVKIRYVPGFLEKVFRDLEVDSNDKTVIISHSLHLNSKDKQFLLDYLFGQMNVKAVYMQNQAMLSLYSYNVTTGLIVDIGDHIDVLPVIDGVVIEKGAQSLPFAGQLVTENLGKLLTESGYRLFTDIESYVVRYVKENSSEVSLDFQEDMTSSPNPVLVDIERFKLPDDKKLIKVGNIKYRCAEGLFNPGLWGKDVSPLQSLIERSIKACEIDQRRELCRNIFLSGGTSMLKGLSERLEDELNTLFPEGISIDIHSCEHRLNAAYRGAIVVCGLENFKDLVISRNEWTAESAESLLGRWTT